MKIILGKTKSGKSTYIYDDIKSELDKSSDNHLILIVPDQMTYQAEVDIITRLNVDGFISLEVLSFKRLEEKILDEFSRPSKKEISPIAKRIILKEIYEEKLNNFQIYKTSTNKEGLVEEFNQLIKELKENNIGPDFLVSLRNEVDKPILKKKLADIACLYSQYIIRTQEDFIDQEDKTDLVISRVKDSNLIGNSKIWIDGFESFTPKRRKLLEAISKKSLSLSVSLNIDYDYVKDLEAFYDWESFKTTYNTYKQLEGFGQDMETISLKESFIASDQIRFLNENIFAIDNKKYLDQVNDIEILSSVNNYTELENMAFKIMDLVIDNNYRWRDIKLAVTDIDLYKTDIKKVFDSLSIPYFLDIKRDLRKNPISRYILSILDIFIWNFRYEDVFQYLKTSFSNLTREEISMLENHVLEFGIEGNKWNKDIGPIDEEMLGIKENFLASFKDQVDNFRSLKTIEEIRLFIIDYLNLNKLDKKVNKIIDDLNEANKFEEASLYLQSFTAIVDLLKDLVLVGEKSLISPLEYRNMLEKSLKDIKISLIPPSIDRVEIGDIDKISVSKPKALFILGLNEGKMENSKINGLLDDEERIYLGKHGIDLQKTSDFLYFKDRHMLYKLFSSPSEKIFISYPSGTVDGKTLDPSLYIAKIKEIFPDIIEKNDFTDKDDIKAVGKSHLSYNKFVDQIWNYIENDHIDPLWHELYLWYKDNDKDKIDQLERGLNYIAEPAKLDPIHINEIFKDSEYITVSKLENFANCQFKYFIDNILKPKERKIEMVQAYDLGNIYHGVLEDFVDKLIEIEDMENLSDKDIDSIISLSLEKVFNYFSKNNSAFESNNRNKYLKEKSLRVLLRTGHTIFRQIKGGQFRPKYTELQIGDFNKNNPKVKRGLFIDSIPIEDQEDSLKLRGKIDRVDIYKEGDQTYINVVDYKSSSKDMDFTEISQGMGNQLLVYLYALVENGHKLLGSRPRIGGIFYYHVNDPIISSNTNYVEDEIFKSLKLKGYTLDDKDIIIKMDKDLGSSSSIIPVRLKKDGDFYADAKVLSQVEFEKLLDYAMDKVKDQSRQILKGEFLINPFKRKDRLACDYCDYISICQFDDLQGNKYRRVNEVSKVQFFEEINKKEADTSGMD